MLGPLSKLYNTLTQAIEEGLVDSAHGIYKGGLGVALAQISFAGGYGLEIDLDKVPTEGTLKMKKYYILNRPAGF